MGDVHEFTTSFKNKKIFYKIANDALIIDIKGESNAAIGLASRPGECEYWVMIGFNNKCSIKKNIGKSLCSVSTRNILSRDKYKQFWITLKNGKICLGENDQNTLILYHQTLMNNLHYVTFSTLDARYLIQWKLHLPPQIEKPTLIRMKGGEPQWVRADEQLPDDALIGGHEKGALYIIRAHHRGSLTPGKFVPELGLGFVPWGGDMIEKNEFEVLCGYNCIWVKTIRNEIPVGAVEGGYSEDGQEILYIGRALYDNHLIPGKVQPSHNCCYIPYNGREIANKTYEILIVPHSLNHAVNNFDLFFSHLDIRNYDYIDNTEGDIDVEENDEIVGVANISLWGDD